MRRNTMQQDNDFTAVCRALRQAKHVAVLTGAGISAESGITTFRDALTGLWSRFDAMALATPDAFQDDPALVWGWYEWRRMMVLRSQPNAGHVALVELAKHVPQLTVITQNVDDLHERAGSRDVLHLHGSLHAPRCFSCDHPAAFASGIPDEPEEGRRLQPPTCTQCGGPIRPGVVWFNEALPSDIWLAAETAVRQCDVLLTIGTSGLVYPAAGLPALAQRQRATIVVINPNATAQDQQATYGLRGTAGQVLPALVQAMSNRDE
jgi:NAD-dependent deacetylase